MTPAKILLEAALTGDPNMITVATQRSIALSAQFELIAQATSALTGRRGRLIGDAPAQILPRRRSISA
jgi:hypothetical protein